MARYDGCIKGHGGNSIEYGRWASSGVDAFGFLSGILNGYAWAVIV
jgi:hypothetical protein